MGYRSTVAYTIRFIPDTWNHQVVEESGKKAKESFYTFLAEAKTNPEISIVFNDDCLEVVEDRLEIRFFVDGVKWYESYEEVNAHESLMTLSQEWCEDNNLIGGCFARIGEDVEDNDWNTWGRGDYQWISVERSLLPDWD